MISVIIPVYNTGPSLARCVDSVLASTYGEFELILVNDGSTDNSPELCREYARRDRRVRLIEQENQGVSVARNRGIDASCGEWIVFVDSDDFISPDFFEMVAQEEPADLLIFDFMKAGQDWTGTPEGPERMTVPLRNVEDRAVLIEQLLRVRQLAQHGNTDLRSPCGKAYRRSVLEQHSVRFTPGVRVGEDTLFNAEFFLNMQSCRYIPLPVYLYTVRMGSTSHSFVPGLLQSFSIFQKRLYDLLAAHRLFPRLEKTYAAKTLENMAYILIKGIFNPYSTNTAHRNRELCRQMREDEIYSAALKYNLRIGNLPRRIMLCFFQLRCYWIVKIICRVCFLCIEQLDKREEKRDASAPGGGAR